MVLWVVTSFSPTKLTKYIPNYYAYVNMWLFLHILYTLFILTLSSLVFTVLVSKTSKLDYINFTWNKMTAFEFEKHWRENNRTEKIDFLHMIQVGHSWTNYRSFIRSFSDICILTIYCMYAKNTLEYMVMFMFSSDAVLCEGSWCHHLLLPQPIEQEWETSHNSCVR